MQTLSKKHREKLHTWVKDNFPMEKIAQHASMVYHLELCHLKNVQKMLDDKGTAQERDKNNGVVYQAALAHMQELKKRQVFGIEK
jgi:hypothetical protein